MKYMTASEIRQMWLDFFHEKGHMIESSAPLVPINDPTLLWINAGVAPLKKYFDGSEKPPKPRITNAQKCIRTNDIENVGKTARHHTFFEMLGNFSIGDYFKVEAIEMAYELLFSERWFHFDINKMYFTIYPTDELAYETWIRLGIKADHIVRLDGNFWEIGDGPCGPDTEIFYDRGEAFDPRGIELLINDISNDRYIEIWNIVFSQFNAKDGLSRDMYPELPNKNIDTGCGLERMACVIQGVDTNYETDLFMPIIQTISSISGVTYEGQMAFKVIADHVRTVTFAIADGAVLSNEGRGYVLRRVLRRASKYAKKLGIHHPFMALLVDDVITIMGNFYPYLREREAIVKMIITKEETKFLETLNAGEKKLEEFLKHSVDKTLSGVDAFTLYDTYGFPIELTEEYVLEHGYSVDLIGFKVHMQAQKERARKARHDMGSMSSQNESFMAFHTPSRFVGYTTLETESLVIKVFEEGVVLDQTPFYATSGGQLADAGEINGIEVLDVVKMPNGQFLHHIDGTLTEGQKVYAAVYTNKRENTMKNHSATHLLHQALKDVLGTHVNQQGSQVSDTSMRFDFNHYTPLTDEEIVRLEDIVNAKIKAELPSSIQEMPLEEAKKKGAMALFDEKYGDVVRVVDMGYSIELCGGTHVDNTKRIEGFALLGVESIGSGIYRIEGVAGKDFQTSIAMSAMNLKQELRALKDKESRLLEEAKNQGFTLNASNFTESSVKLGYRYVLALRETLQNQKEHNKALEKELRVFKERTALSRLEDYMGDVVGNILITKVQGLEIDTLKQLVDALFNKMQGGLVFIASIVEDKVIFVCKQNINQDAGQLVKQAALITNGNGGGRKDMAQAGGKDVTLVDQALAQIKEAIK